MDGNLRNVCAKMFHPANACVEERIICVRYFSRKLDGGVAICLFNELHDFAFVYISDPGLRVLIFGGLSFRNNRHASPNRRQNFIVFAQ